MLRLGPRRRALLAEALRDLANLVAAGLVVGQLITREPLSLSLFLSGIAIWFSLLGLALVLTLENVNG